MAPTLASIPNEYFSSGHNPACQSTADPNCRRTLFGIPLCWKNKSSYCGKSIPVSLELQGTINWLEQKTAVMPCEEHLSEEENLERFQEFKEMRELLSKLKLKRIQVRLGILR